MLITHSKVSFTYKSLIWFSGNKHEKYQYLSYPDSVSPSACYRQMVLSLQPVMITISLQIRAIGSYTPLLTIQLAIFQLLNLINDTVDEFI